MKFNGNAGVIPAIAEKSKRDIDAVNDYVDGLKGVLVCVETLSHYQAPYADTVMKSRITCYQPNVKTTNAPLVRLIGETEARELAKMFVAEFTDSPKPEWHQTRLDSIVPVADPAGIDDKEPRNTVVGIRSASWEVTIVRPNCE